MEFDVAERRASAAEETLGNLLPVFALLDAIDEFLNILDNRIGEVMDRHLDEYHPKQLTC